jgi:hypothetical protein
MKNVYKLSYDQWFSKIDRILSLFRLSEQKGKIQKPIQKEKI